jgi:hypothetical protein
VAYLFEHRFLLRGVVSKFLSVAFIYQASNAQMITVLRVLGVLEEHHVQVLLALSISSALCLAAWIWARRRLIRFQASVDRQIP